MIVTFSMVRRWITRIAAPAKINLGLNVLGRRPDGYHLLSSLVTFVSLWDYLSFSFFPGSGTISVDSSHVDAPGGPSNLATRAAEAFLGALSSTKSPAVSAPVSIDIRIQKGIPVGAGLGGGSSDAAATLLALNRYFKEPFSQDELGEIGLSLGADVPLFVRGQSGVIGGIGEEFTEKHPGPNRPMVLAFEGTGLLTKKVFAEYDRFDATHGGDAHLQNDLEEAAIRLSPGIGRLLRKLETLGGFEARMTGSGAAVFASFGSFRAAQQAAKSAREAGIWARAVYTLENSVVTL